MDKILFHPDEHPAKDHSYWRRAAMTISFFMVLLATLFIILLSRVLDKELSFYSLRSDFHQEAQTLLIRLIEMDAVAYNLKQNPTKSLKKPFEKAKAQLLESMNRLNRFSLEFNEIQHWSEKLHHYIQTQMEVLEETDLPEDELRANQNRLQGELMHLLRRISNSLAEETRGLANNKYELDLLRAGLSFAAIIASISTFLLAYAVYDRFRRDMCALRQYQKQLYQDNLLLEARVELRTQELKEAQRHAEHERKRAELLLQDASHRIGNSLATVSSLLGLQAKNSPNEEAKSALMAARDRIQNIGAAHRRLRLGNDGETAAIDELLSLIINDIKADLPEEVSQRITIEHYIEPWQIKARDATTLGIIMSELLINAIKHAFPDHKEGRIFVSFLQRDDGHLALIVEDNGKGISEEEQAGKKAGLGHLIAKQLCVQFGAEPYKETPEGGGTRFVVPLPSLKDQARLKTQNISKPVVKTEQKQDVKANSTPHFIKEAQTPKKENNLSMLNLEKEDIPARFKNLMQDVALGVYN